MPLIKQATPEALQEAAQLIRGGGLVALPTETVYGLGANALDGKAVARIFEAKGRPAINPVIVHVLSVDEAQKYVVMNAAAQKVAASFWAGALTMILPRRVDCSVSELCSAGLPTLAVRVPSHPVMRAVIEAAGVPIAAPSANRSGTISPTTPLHVAESLGDAVDMILAAGACAIGLESTVLDMSGDVPVVLRPGAISAEEIAAVLGHEVTYDFGAHDKPRSPGQLLRHYAPSVPLRLNAIDIEQGEALLAFGSIKFMGIKGGGAAKDLPPSMLRNLSDSGDLHEAAANLFRYMRELDKPDHQRIAVMNIPDQGLGIAINERLRRAADSNRSTAPTA